MQTNDSIATVGSLIAIRSTMSYLLALACRDDDKALSDLYGILAGNIETAMDSAREKLKRAPESTDLTASIQASAMRELDLIFLTSRGILERNKES